MWLSDDAGFAKAHGLTLRRARLRATAEHLVARQDGGKSGSNIVAACLLCNNARHAHRPANAPDPDRYRARVQSQMAKDRWHPCRVGCEP